MNPIHSRRSLASLLISASLTSFAIADLAKEFASPPDAARPGAYWYFMDGNQDRDEMVADLHAMKKAGRPFREGPAGPFHASDYQ